MSNGQASYTWNVYYASKLIRKLDFKLYLTEMNHDLSWSIILALAYMNISQLISNEGQSMFSLYIA